MSAPVAAHEALSHDRRHVALVTEPIDVTALLGRVRDNGVGALTLFLGTVRDNHEGRAVTGIDYEAYDAMALSELESIAAESAHDVPELRLAIEHRLGTLGLGDISVAIAAGHPRRAAALNASQRIIEAIKHRVPIWKREHYAEGDWSWVDPTRPATGSPTLGNDAEARERL